MQWRSTTWASLPIRKFDSSQTLWTQCPSREWRQKKPAWLFGLVAEGHALHGVKVLARNRHQSEDARARQEWRRAWWAKQKRTDSSLRSTCTVESIRWIGKRFVGWPGWSEATRSWWAKNEAVYRSKKGFFALAFQGFKNNGQPKVARSTSISFISNCWFWRRLHRHPLLWRRQPWQGQPIFAFQHAV